MESKETDGPALPAGVVLAPYWRRMVGLTLDQVLAAVPPFLLFIALGYSPKSMLEGTPGFWFNIMFVTVGLTYETLCVWRWGRTIGKWATRTRVVHVLTGGAVALSSAFIRSLVPAAFGAIPGIGLLLGMSVYLWAFVDPRRQGLHDKAAGTLVSR
jgi:uncharacterized RDD family membrane protein YckC